MQKRAGVRTLNSRELLAQRGSMKNKRLGSGIALMSVLLGLAPLLVGCGDFWALPVTATTSTLTSTSYSMTAGNSFTLTGTVKISSSGDTATAATGTIEFYDKTTSTDLGTVSISSGSASVTTSFSAVETHVIEAIYSGDSTYASSTSSTISVVINSSSGSDSATTTVLTSTSYSTTASTDFTLTGTVEIVSSSATATAATGTIEFYDATTSTDLGTVSINSGVATLTTSLSAAETHVIEAIYTTGDTDYASSTSSTINVVISSSSISLDLFVGAIGKFLPASFNTRQAQLLTGERVISLPVTAIRSTISTRQSSLKSPRRNSQQG